MVTKSLARELNWTGKPFQLTLRGIGDTKRLVQSEKVSLSINSLMEEFSKEFKDVMVVQEIYSAIKAIDWTNYLSKLSLKSHKPIDEGNIVMLIGTDQPDMHIQHQNIAKSEKHPIAIKYNLGWTFLGKTIDRAAATDPAVLLNKRDESYNLKGLNDLLERTWTHDSLPSESNTVDENHCICLLADSYKVVYRRATVSPLFKPGKPTPGINKN
jgi:hypothetical protein